MFQEGDGLTQIVITSDALKVMCQRFELITIYVRPAPTRNAPGAFRIQAGCGLTGQTISIQV